MCVWGFCFWTADTLEKTLITLMQAFHACAARRCLRYAQTCFAAALELPTLFSKSKSNAKAAAKQVRATRGQRREHQRYLRFVLMGLELWKQSNSI